jgi:hypothetical protein
MKKLFLVLITFSFVTTVNSQILKLGIKGGASVVNFVGDDANNTESFVTFHAGAVSELKLSKKFALQPELIYSQQGSSRTTRTETPIESSLNFSDIELSYVQVPLLAKFYITNKLSFEIGPRIGFLLSAKDDFSFRTDNNRTEGEVDIKDSIKNADLSFVLSLSHFFGKKFFVNTRYNIGTSNIFEDDTNIKNAVFQCSIGYLFLNL